MDAVNDDITWKNAMDLYQDFNSIDGNSIDFSPTFDHLRCSRGAGENLSSSMQDLFMSAPFWYSAMFVSISVIVTECAWYWRRRKNLTVILVNEHQSNDSDIGTIPEEQRDGRDQTMAATVEEGNFSNMTSARKTFKMLKQSCHLFFMKYKIRKYCMPMLFVGANLLLLFIICLSILSLLEFEHGMDLPFTLKTLTPACTSTMKFCPDAQMPIERPSISKSDALTTFKPFSYLIASDTQLDWYAGESAYLGQLNYPPPCSEKDSCDSCTKKFGTYSNQQMVASMESLIAELNNLEALHYNLSSPPHSSSSEIISGVPIAVKGLVMNGDLTQYFHREERKKFTSLYHNIDGLEQYFPSLGNHDYDQGSGATYNGDEWVGPHYCNGKHAIAYFQSAFCNKIPHFDAKRRVTRFDPKSLAYSWDEGIYHFVHLHYHPTYENAGLQISNSLEWMERDLKLANEKELTTVLFIHAASGLPSSLENVILNSKVAVIFAGHLHRCVGKKCSIIRAFNTKDAQELIDGNGTSSSFDGVGKCFPASAALCGGRINSYSNSLFYIDDKDATLSLPRIKLFSEVPQQKGKCPVGKYATFVNHTDNTILCKEKSIRNSFPYIMENLDESPKNRTTTIPIIWSGSASFETFLRADFLADRIVINVMTATTGNEGRRYIDTHDVPNAVYPFHTASDMDEITVFVQ